jgi:hypothetical protein
LSDAGARAVGVRRVGLGLALVTVTLAVRLVPAWFLRLEAGDIEAYHVLGDAVLRGDNVYAHRLFHYSPYTQFLLAWMVRASASTGWSFSFVAKLPSILADAGVSALLFGFLLRRGASSLRSFLWSFAWAMNPVSILGSAFHGNLMEIVPFLTLGSYVVYVESSSERDLLIAVSALLLGLAIAVRPNPVLLLPVFLLLGRVRDAPLFASLALLPASFASLPYLLYARQVFLREVLGYLGMTDFGWLAIARGSAYALRGVNRAAFDIAVTTMTRNLFLGAYVLFLLTLPFFRRSSLGRALLVPSLLFYVLYGNLSAQYLVWVVPIALALEEGLALAYTLVAGAAMVLFYAIYQPDLLFSDFPRLLPGSRPVLLLYVAANACLVAVSALWVFRILRQEIRLSGREPDPDGLAWRLPTRLRRRWPGLVLGVLGCWFVYLAMTLERAARATRDLLTGG